jgi:hypothetical protein
MQPVLFILNISINEGIHYFLLIVSAGAAAGAAAESAGAAAGAASVAGAAAVSADISVVGSVDSVEAPLLEQEIKPAVNKPANIKDITIFFILIKVLKLC